MRAIVNIAKLATPRGDGAVGGPAMGRLLEIEDAAIVVDESGVILEVGPRSTVKIPEGADEVDAGGRLVVPGLVDPHTHAVYAGERSFEVEHKVGGKSYLEIQQMGGGIYHTVEATRGASVEDLVATGRRRLALMLREGTTTVEVKSGYGLDTEHEVKMLRAIDQLKQSVVQEVVPTLLAAHALPHEWEGRRESYLHLVASETIPAVVNESLAQFVDVWCDAGAFTPSECQTVLEAGRRAGLGLRLHADELGRAGGAGLAAEMRASSADHLLEASREDFRLLRTAGVVPVIAPAAPLVLLSHRWPDARTLIGDGVPFALATDFNPNCQMLSMQRAMALAVYMMRTPPKAALTAATLNAAVSLNRGALVGSIQQGKLCDLAFVDAKSVDEFATDLSSNRVVAVVKRGEVFHNR